jgi:hypothetical protein
MGSDPRRLDGLRTDEQVAARLVERATGATARAHDVGRRQGAYDVHLTYPGGRTAALEVTTHTGETSRRGTTLLHRDRLSPSGRWHTSPDRAQTASQAAQHPSSPGLRPDGDTVLQDLPDAVTALLAEPHVARRAGKVTAAPRVDERHLFVAVGPGGLPDSVYRRLRAPLRDLPAHPPEAPAGLTHLWLTTEWPGSPLLGWNLDRGWQVFRV